MVPLLHHFQPIWIKAWFNFFPCVQFPFWWHFCFLINSRQSIYPKPVFYVFQLSEFSHTWFGRCPARKLLRLRNIWKAFCRNGGLESHIIPLYVVTLFLFSLYCVFQFLVIWKRYLKIYQLNLIIYLQFQL